MQWPPGRPQLGPAPVTFRPQVWAVTGEGHGFCREASCLAGDGGRIALWA